MTQPRPGIPFVAAAPSGTGKTTICRGVLSRDPSIRFSVSHTTRPPRQGEVDGRDYHFVRPDAFRRMVDAGDFVEHAEYAGHLYGTSWRSLEEPLSEGFDLLIEIEVQGARQIRERRTDARFLFLLPPSLGVLEQRLRGRGTDSDEVIEHRLALADRELEAVSFFDYVIVNDQIEACVASVLEIVAAERAGDLDRVVERYGRERALARWRAAEGST